MECLAVFAMDTAVKTSPADNKLWPGGFVYD